MPPDALTPATSRPRSWASAWLIVWAVAAVVHLTQAIWFQPGTTSPGNLADGRFNQLVLEHGFQSLRGTNAWDSPGQFYPLPHALAFSDTHAGTLPLYAPLRWMGFSIERSWQGWVLACAVLDAWAAGCLLAALGCGRWLRGPLIFALASSASMVWSAGAHLQLLPAFTGLFALAQAVKWTEDRSPWRWLAVAGLLAWQFAAGPYLAFFFASLGLSIGTVWLLAGRFVDRRERLVIRTGRSLAVVLAVVGFTLAGINVAVYMKSSSAGMGRSMEEVTYGAPDLATWFSSSPGHLWWKPQSPAGTSDLGEHALFAGALPWIGTLLALGFGWRWRRSTAGQWLLAWSLGVVAMLGFFTKWGESGPGLWLSMADHFPALRAFRSCARIVVVVNFALVAATGTLLAVGIQRVRNALGRFALVALAVLVAVESMAHRQPVFDLKLAKARADGVIEAWRVAGDRPVLAYAYGYANQANVWMQLDAWSAALRTGRKTMNGYSGLVPSLSWSFYWNPTPENARAVAKAGHVDLEQVSIVEGLSPAASQQIGLERLAHQAVTPLVGFELQPIQWNLFGPLERHDASGRVMFQFTPPAEIRFSLPDSASKITFVQSMRAGSYDGTGHSDGVGFTWLVIRDNNGSQEFFSEYLNPRDRPADRGILPRELAVPAGLNRIVILRVDAGTAHDGRWDWPLFGELRAR